VHDADDPRHLRSVRTRGVGFEDGNADSTIERGGGVLRQAPGANVINDASCTWARSTSLRARSSSS
jgi:hypothetical protein